MRDRVYRRYVEDKKVLKRLNNIVNDYWRSYFRDVNRIKVQCVKLEHIIGSESHYMFKTITSKSPDRPYKYSHKRTFYTDNNRKSYRSKDKKKFFKLLKEYGIK
jgi:hypothetical protein